MERNWKNAFFNLYDNGVIEFEFADDKKKTAGKINKAEEINTLKRAKISADELKKFTDLLKSEAFQNTKSDYEKICRSTDAFVDYKINFQNAGRQKNINLYSYCGSYEVRNPGSSNILDFPGVLSDLINLAERTRAKYIPK